MVDLAAEYREKLIESVAEQDEELMMKYLEGEELYKAMIAKRNQLEEEMAFIDQYSTTTIDDDTDEDTAAAYKKAALAAMSDEDYKTYYKVLGTKEVELTELRGEITLSGYGAYKVVAYSVNRDGVRSEVNTLTIKIDDREIEPRIIYSEV